MRSPSSLTVTWPGGIGDPNGPDGQTIPVGGRRKTRRNRKGRKGSRKQRKTRSRR